MSPPMKMNLVIVLFTVAVSTAGIWAFLHNNQSQPYDLSEPHQHEQTPEADRDLHGKPGADVRLTSPPIYVMEPNELRDVILILETGHSGTLQVSLSVDSGLQLNSSQTEWQFDSDTDALQVPVSLYAEKEGRYLLQLQVVTHDADGRQEHRSLAAEVRVGLDEHEMHYDKHRATGERAPAHVPLDVIETIE